jgi:ubiquinone/menaquinone biosynthesis C-methylase UbiE
MWYRLLAPIYKRAAVKMCRTCSPFIKERDRVLDLGCGSAIISQVLKDYFQADVMGADVIDRRIFPIPFRIIDDGKTLPFANKEFDEVLIAYVLHHAENPEALLKEAVRVAKDKIIIFEDLPEGTISSFFCRIHGFSFDNFFGNKSHTSFKTGEEWEKLFKQLNLEIIDQGKASSFYDPVKKRFFVLEKRGA